MKFIIFNCFFFVENDDFIVLVFYLKKKKFGKVCCIYDFYWVIYRSYNFFVIKFFVYKFLGFLGFFYIL